MLGNMSPEDIEKSLHQYTRHFADHLHEVFSPDLKFRIRRTRSVCAEVTPADVQRGEIAIDLFFMMAINEICSTMYCIERVIADGSGSAPLGDKEKLDLCCRRLRRLLGIHAPLSRRDSEILNELLMDGGDKLTEDIKASVLQILHTTLFYIIAHEFVHLFFKHPFLAPSVVKGKGEVPGFEEFARMQLYRGPEDKADMMADEIKEQHADLYAGKRTADYFGPKAAVNAAFHVMLLSTLCAPYPVHERERLNFAHPVNRYCLVFENFVENSSNPDVQDKHGFRVRGTLLIRESERCE